MKPVITWIGAHANNYYKGRNGKQVKYIVFHHAVSTLAGTDATFLSPNSIVSAHYGVGLNEIHQYVELGDTAYATRNEDGNYSGISIEHAGTWLNGYRDQRIIDKSAELVAWLRTLYPNAIPKRHREFSATACCGDLPVEEIWDKATQLMQGGTMPTEPEINIYIGEQHKLAFGTAPSDNIFASQRESYKKDFSKTALEISTVYANHPDALANKVMNEGDRVNINDSIFGKDMGYFKGSVGMNWKEGIYYGVLGTTEFVINQLVNDGDIPAIKSVIGVDSKDLTGRNWKDLFYSVIYPNSDNLSDKVNSLTQVNNNLLGEVDRLKKQVESLQAQQGDSNKWGVLKALIRELIGK